MDFDKKSAAITQAADEDVMEVSRRLIEENQEVCAALAREQMYRILLPDYSTPSFITMDKPYYGTQEEILQTLSEHTGRWHEDAVAFFNGAAVQDAFIIPVSIVREEPLSITDFKTDYHNTWDFVSKIEADSVSGKIVYVQEGDALQRCFRLQFVNLRIDGLPVMEDTLYGCPGVLSVDASDPERIVTSNRLMCCDNSEELSFLSFFDDIFGDG